MQFHFLELFPKTPTFDFVAQAAAARHPFAHHQRLACCCGHPFIHGLNFGVDFAGGTEMEAKFAQLADLSKVDQALKRARVSRSEAAQASGRPRNTPTSSAWAASRSSSPADAERARGRGDRGVSQAGAPRISTSTPSWATRSTSPSAEPVDNAALQKAITEAGVKVSEVRELAAPEEPGRVRPRHPGHLRQGAWRAGGGLHPRVGRHRPARRVRGSPGGPPAPDPRPQGPALRHGHDRPLRRIALRLSLRSRGGHRPGPRRHRHAGLLRRPRAGVQPAPRSPRS